MPSSILCLPSGVFSAHHLWRQLQLSTGGMLGSFFCEEARIRCELSHRATRRLRRDQP